MKAIANSSFHSSFALKYASEELRSDIEFVLAAVSNNGISLEYTSEELKVLMRKALSKINIFLKAKNKG